MNPITFRCSIAGISHYDWKLAQAEGKATPGTGILLSPEPTNPHDMNAIEVFLEAQPSYKLGYIPKDIAALLAPLFSWGCPVSATMNAMGGLSITLDPPIPHVTEEEG